MKKANLDIEMFKTDIILKGAYSTILDDPFAESLTDSVSRPIANGHKKVQIKGRSPK
jgi:hypothetical protein